MITFKRRALFLASLTWTNLISEGVDNKIKNPRDVSGFKKSFWKKDKNDVNGMIFFVSLGWIIMNSIASIFV